MTNATKCRGVFVADFQTGRQITPEGYLVAPAKIARTGIQSYRARELGLAGVDGDKVIRLFRPAEEVFSPAAIASFESKPIADNHPAAGDINANNWKSLAVGDIRDVGADGEYLGARVIVRDKGAIDKINGGKSQVSCGYVFDCDLTPGQTPAGESFDGYQRNIRGNHVAIVDVGRAGSNVRIADGLTTGGRAIDGTPVQRFGGRAGSADAGRMGGRSASVPPSHVATEAPPPRRPMGGRADQVLRQLAASGAAPPVRTVSGRTSFRAGGVR